VEYNINPDYVALAKSRIAEIVDQKPLF